MPALGPQVRGSFAPQKPRRWIGAGSGPVAYTSMDSCVGGHVMLSNGLEVDSSTIVWTAGVKPNPALARFGLPLGPKGHVDVDATMQVRGREYVTAARAIGCSVPRILWSEVLPAVNDVVMSVSTQAVFTPDGDMAYVHTALGGSNGRGFLYAFDSSLNGSGPTPTAIPPTATATVISPTATATVIPPTATATSVPPSSNRLFLPLIVR